MSKLYDSDYAYVVVVRKFRFEIHFERGLLCRPL